MKVMVKRDTSDEIIKDNQILSESSQPWSTMKTPRKLTLMDDEEMDGDKGEAVDVPLVRSKRYVWVPHSGKSPHSVSYAANYNEQENKGWVKPLFSSIVYRLPV